MTTSSRQVREVLAWNEVHFKHDRVDFEGLQEVGIINPIDVRNVSEDLIFWHH